MAKRYLAKLLLALPFIVAMAPAMADSPRTIDVTVSREAFSPRRIDVRLGEPVRLRVTSTDHARAVQIRALGVSARVPAGGTPVAVDLRPTEEGTFVIQCSDSCGSDPSGMSARLVVTQ